MGWCFIFLRNSKSALELKRFEKNLSRPIVWLFYISEKCSTRMTFKFVFKSNILQYIAILLLSFGIPNKYIAIQILQYIAIQIIY